MRGGVVAAIGFVFYARIRKNMPIYRGFGHFSVF